MNATETTVVSRLQLLEKQLLVLYRVSSVLNKSLDMKQTLAEVLRILHDDAGMHHGIVTLSDPSHGGLSVGSIHVESEAIKRSSNSVRYRPGEGIIGRIFESGESIVLGRISTEPRFLDKLELYDLELPFISVPIKSSDGKVIGVLAAQPAILSDIRVMLPDCTRLMEMVANLIVQTITLAQTVETEKQDIKEERDELRRQVRSKYGFDNMVVGHTEQMRRVFDQVRRVAKWDSTVLIRGESGTGKELIASAIHYNSPYANNPFVKLNCAALPETLLESELFGHEKGAFTGAVRQRKGRFEQADGGTLFLDEIGEISPLFQAKLLRVLQEGELERVGGTTTVRVNVRIVAATNRNLEAEVEQGNFREDLYYRLNVMPIKIPPLRERVEDIPELTEFLLAQLGKQQGRKLTVTDNAQRMLMSHHWPGNVRELSNCLERAAVMCENGVIDRDVIFLSGLDIDSAVSIKPSIAQTSLDINDPDMDERERVVAALEQAGWVQAKAARLLGMTPRQIAYRIQSMNIRVRKI
ncbi:nif-specific transcriptional activator NifA [Gynuella sunshinyii]|uniref:Nif-specific regulatory protein n=1 Tax=Gynuella sunshinyii YC6258 TaxID=1445510 RepID=A0A0C5VII3_9GAMM|nr:nif-specific transcriptional activator NifA [Gynuella sunshinyii]AJQ94076.1 transcriptional regulator containing GAF, AAA-type ATPase, and DNA binding domain [Gynuella sunshinyii YC6258]